MRLESVLALKAEMRDKLKASAGGQTRIRTYGLGDILVDRPAPGVAIGVGAGKKRSDYTLALRITRATRSATQFVELIRDKTRGEVDVLTVGPIAPLASVPSQRRKRRPLTPGDSVGHFRVEAGSIGAFVADSRNRLCVLSANHVLADSNRGNRGDPVLQPGRADGGRSKDWIGDLGKYIVLSATTSNEVDAAVAIVNEEIEIEGNIYNGRRLRGWRPSVRTNLPVSKVGRTTGATTGKVTAFALDDVEVPYRDLGVCYFDDQIEVVGDNGDFSAPGDSGALVLARSNLAVGLLFAGSASTNRTYLNPMGKVLLDLDCTLLL